jgi:predicted aspartyl protease
MNRFLLLALATSSACLSVSGAAKTVIPFENDNNFVIATVWVGKSGPLSFLVDTGASSTVIDSARLREAQLNRGTQIKGTTQGGAIDAESILDVSVRVGKLSLPPMTIAAVSLAGLSAGAGRSIDGVLGEQFFRNRVMQFDYDKKKMTVFEPGEYKTDGAVVPLEIINGTPFAGVFLRNGSAEYPAFMLVDTGATGAATLNARFVSKTPAIVPRNVIALTSGAILPGSFQARVGRVDAIRLGGYVLSSPVTQFASSASADEAGEKDNGLIGGDLLRRFRVTVDYAGRRMVIKPSRAYREPFEFDASGISLISTGSGFTGKTVRMVIKGSPGDLAGIKSGDTIASINGKPVAAMPLKNIRKTLRVPERSVRLGVNRGGEPLMFVVRTRRLV